MYTISPAPLTPRYQDGARLQLLITCGLLSVLVAIVATLSLQGIIRVRGFAHEAVAVDGQLSRLASDVAAQTLESRRYEKDFFLNVGDRRIRDDYLTKWQASSQELDRAIAAFAAAASTPEDQRQAASWRKEASQYISDFGQIARAVMEEHITTSQAANEAFTPFKENIRVLTESSVAVADRRATLAAETDTTIEAAGARTIGFVGLLGFLALTVAVGFDIADTLPFRRTCVDCDEWLPLSRWFGGEHRCLSCELHRLGHLIDSLESTMLAFSAEERARLAYLVPMAQRLFAGDVHRYSLWIGQLSDHERALLVRWIAHYGPNWHTAPLPKVDQ